MKNMRKRFTKGLRPIFAKRLALLMGICYMMNPLYEPINFALHEISHLIDSLNHHESLNSQSHYKSHNHKDHQLDTLQHEHTLVDIIYSIFETSNENNSNKDSILTEIKIDKHITTYRYQFEKGVAIGITQKFWAPEEKSKAGYFKRLKRPPQNFLHQSL